MRSDSHICNDDREEAGAPYSPPNHKPVTGPSQRHASIQQQLKKASNKMAGGQSTNHLLNFQLPPRASQAHHNGLRRSKRPAQGYGLWNKEKFVNAQYRFVVRPSGDYTVHFADPDIFFQWSDILQVIVPRKSALATATERQDASPAQNEGVTTCPICLSPPTAPRMTKCGHVFCFPCVLHYLNTSDNAKWSRCPICFDSINEKQLKSVKWTDDTSLNGSTSSHAESSHLLPNANDAAISEGSILHFRLMQRPQITTLALPRSNTWPSDVLPPHQAPFHFLPDVCRFARFMLATPSYLLSNLGRDLDELQIEKKLLNDMKDDLSLEFVEAAEDKVLTQMAKAVALDTPVLRDAVAKVEQTKKDVERGLEERVWRSLLWERQGLGTIRDECLSVQRNPLGNATSTTEPRVQRARRNINLLPPSSSAYYFYQAASGLPIFLHPLDIRILLSHFSSYSSFPNDITIRVYASAEGSIDGDLRRRCKYLLHIPESADVVFVEADLRGVVSDETLKAFEIPLKARAQKRRERGRKEDRAKARADMAERETLRLPRWSMPTAGEVSSNHRSGSTPKGGGHADHDLAATIASTSLDDSSSALSPNFVALPPSSGSSGTGSGASEAMEPPPTSGAWGTQTFASAAQAARRGHLSGMNGRIREAGDEWDVDTEWHELDTRVGGTGRRKKVGRMLVLGGGGRRQ